MRADNYLSVGAEGTWENVEMHNRYYANSVKNYEEQSMTKRGWKIIRAAGKNLYRFAEPGKIASALLNVFLQRQMHKNNNVTSKPCGEINYSFRDAVKLIS